MTATLTKPQHCRRQVRQTASSQLSLVYVAGPYTRPDPVENTHDIVKIADALLDAGFIPVVPHLTLLWHLISPKPYAHWLAYDQHLLARCDAVLRVPGHSVGATRETELAESLGIPVIR